MVAKPKSQPKLPHACLCSIFSANPADLTEQDLASGEFETWTTGCDRVTFRKFAAGHDATLKSFLIQHGFRGSEIHREVGGFVTTTDAVSHAAVFGFAAQVRKGIENARAKAAAKAARPVRVPKTPAERKASAQRVVKAVRSKPHTVRAKVGRWTYEGVVNAAQQFVYSDSAGTEHVVTRYTLVL